MIALGFCPFIVWLLLCGSNVYSIRTPYILHGQVQSGNQPLKSEEWVAAPWINDDFKFGQVSGVSVDSNDDVYLFHRVDRKFDGEAFINDKYTGIKKGPIKEPTILVFSSEGKLLNNLGQNMFYLPHGITVDYDFNIWVTDVALHQVMKLSPKSNNILLELGEKFIPGSDSKHFCKPTSVAVVANGDFFVADGYCNSRIIKFNSEGIKISQWGRERNVIRYKPGLYELRVPHALTLVEEKGLLCVADRENGRIVCYTIKDGTNATEITSPYMGNRIFSVAYSSISGGKFFVINGQGFSKVPVRGFVVDMGGNLVGIFGSELKYPHDIATSLDGRSVYVVEIGPNRVWKFIYNKTYISDSQITDKSQALPVENRSTEINKSSDVEGLTGAILVTVGCFVFAFGIFFAIIFYSKSRKSGNSDTKRLLSNLDY